MGNSSSTSVQYAVNPPLLGKLSLSLTVFVMLALIPEAEDSFDFFDKIVDPRAIDLLLSIDYLLL
jgi:hypothetical protein